jgi:hypothetical protein
MAISAYNLLEREQPELHTLHNPVHAMVTIGEIGIHSQSKNQMGLYICLCMFTRNQRKWYKIAGSFSGQFGYH